MSTTSDCVRIENNIFFGNYLNLKNCEEFKKLRLSKVFTIGSNRMKSSDQLSNIYYKYLPVLNEDIEEIIFRFDDCFRFISEAQNYDENILINCSNDLSISICVLTAFLMKKYRMSTELALKRISQKGQTVSLETEFEHQLNVWQNMSFDLKANNSDLRRIQFRCFKKSIEQMIETIHSSNSYNIWYKSSVKYWIRKIIIEELDQFFEPKKQYFCLKCNRILFCDCDVFENDVPFECQYIYSEPNSWNFIQTTRRVKYRFNFIFDEIRCPKCTVILGEFNWRPIKVCECPLHRGLDSFQVYKYFANKLKQICD